MPASVVSAADAGLDPAFKWYASCDTHNTLVGAKTRKAAESAARSPDDWCDGCRSAGPTFYFYKAPPFSAPRYRENHDRTSRIDGADSCGICGRPVKTPVLYRGAVVHGGAWAETMAEVRDEADPGYMGYWAIGPDCHRKNVIGTIEQEG